jgi:hypothetical protein
VWQSAGANRLEVAYREDCRTISLAKAVGQLPPS